MRASLILASVLSAVLGATAAVAADKAEKKVLNVYNWSDYIAKDTLALFEKETGIKVKYDVYDSNETLEAKLMAGRSGYDVVFPSASPYLIQLIQANVFRPLDKAKLTNLGNLDPAVMKTLESADPGNAYSVPYMIAATGIGYNVKHVTGHLGGAAPVSWSMLFDPDTAAKLKPCGVSLLDTPTEVFPAALAYAGKNPASFEKDDMKLAADMVRKVKPSIRYFHSSRYINDLANGDLCVAHGYVGDLVQARDRAKEAGKGVEVGIVIPKEGAVVNIDVMVIPKDAPHPDNAHLFIDFLMRPEIIAAVTNETGYANAVLPAAKFVDEAIRTDPVIYPPAEVLAREFTVPPAPKAYDRDRTREWTKVKSGK